MCTAHFVSTNGRPQAIIILPHEHSHCYISQAPLSKADHACLDLFPLFSQQLYPSHGSFWRFVAGITAKFIFSTQMNDPLSVRLFFFSTLSSVSLCAISHQLDSAWRQTPTLSSSILHQNLAQFASTSESRFYSSPNLVYRIARILMHCLSGKADSGTNM